MKFGKKIPFEVVIKASANEDENGKETETS